ncbi:MAG: glycosyltransferase family 2 protein [Pseudomonadota bacterium]
MPDVTVVVAAWNVEPFVAAAVESALAQDGVSVEVVVADDASTDGTAAAVERMAGEDPRVVLSTTTENRGPAAARNRAVALARGDWIAVLDADDRFAPGRLAALKSFAEARKADVAFDLFSEVDADGRPIDGSRAPRYDAPRRWALADWALVNGLSNRGGELPPGYMKPLIRKAFLDQHGIAYKERLRNSEDYFLVAEALAAGGSVWSSTEIGYLYTRREGSISHRIGPEHLEALLREERAAQASWRLNRAEAAALATRIKGLEDALACERVIKALKMRAPLRAAGALGARPRAAPLFCAWVAEVLAKRLGTAA